MSLDILEDDRVKWIRQKVALALEISIESFNDYFTESLERARSAGVAREQIAEFLSDASTAGTTLFFSAKLWQEDIEGKQTEFFHSTKLRH